MEIGRKKLGRTGQAASAGRRGLLHPFDTQHLWRIEQYGEAHLQRFRAVLAYRHGMGSVPAIVLGGEPADGYFTSYFDSYLPFANEAICQFSQHQATMVACGFPVREEVALDCDAPNCSHGWAKDESGKPRPCKNCQGNGKLLLRSPLGVYMRPLQQPVGQPADTMPPVRFFAPDTAIIAEQKQSYKDYLREAEKSLSLVFTDEAQSGVAKEIDREEQYSMLAKISGNVFDNIFWNTLWIVEQYREIHRPQLPEVLKPTEFRIKSEREILQDVSTLIQSQAPRPFVVQSLLSLSAKQFSNNPVAQKKIQILAQDDPLFADTDQQVALKLQAGIVAPEEARRHYRAPHLVDQIAAEAGLAFLKMGYGDVVGKMEKMGG